MKDFFEKSQDSRDFHRKVIDCRINPSAVLPPSYSLASGCLQKESFNLLPKKFQHLNAQDGRRWTRTCSLPGWEEIDCHVNPILVLAVSFLTNQLFDKELLFFMRKISLPEIIARWAMILSVNSGWLLHSEVNSLRGSQSFKNYQILWNNFKTLDWILKEHIHRRRKKIKRELPGWFGPLF